jgi:SprT protein
MADNSNLKILVMERLQQLKEIAEEHFGREFEIPTVTYRTTGGCAGKYIRKRSGRRIDFNFEILKRNQSDFIENTVAHEYAHYVQRELYPQSKPHGHEWKSIMRAFGVRPVRCHNYDYTPARRRSCKVYRWRGKYYSVAAITPSGKRNAIYVPDRVVLRMRGNIFVDE